MFASRRRALRRRAGRGRRRRPSRDVPAGAGGDRRRVRGARARARSRGGDRRHRPSRSTRRATCSAISGSCCGDPSRHRRRRRSRARTRSGCRIRRSSGSRRRWRSPTTAATGSSCTSPRSGCTRTASRSPPASACPRSRCGSCSAGVGGAFGAREDISLQVHTCLLALRLGRPVRMHYSRAESFLGHVHRHPATIWMRHHATRRRRDRQDRGPLRVRRRRLRLDLVGGAAQRDHPHAGPVPLPRTRSSRVGRSAPTTCRAGRCAASGSCRPASPTSRSSTCWPRPAGSTRSRSACATRSAPAIG